MAENMEDLFSAMGVSLDDDPDEIKHYGVPGMRWGKRKGGGGSSRSASPKITVKALSDDQLRTAITRMKLEQEFIKLATPVPSPGRRAVQKMVADVAKQTAEAYLKKGMAEGGDIVKAAMDARKAAKG